MISQEAHDVLTDVTLSFYNPEDALSPYTLDPRRWRRLEKDLLLHSSKESIWLYYQQKQEKDLTASDLIITGLHVKNSKPESSSDEQWESRPGDIWLQRTHYDGNASQAIRAIDVLFGADAVDPRPQWSISTSPLKLNAAAEVPASYLTVRRGKSQPRDTPPPLQANKDGKFKIVQISDTHMIAGVGNCTDALGPNGELLPDREADPLTVKFIEEILDVEKPDLVLLTGDQLHHDILDSQSPLLKLVAPLIARSIPYAAIFGNHDSEGMWQLSRKKQMAILQDLPFSLCQLGPEEVDGVGNYILQIYPHDSTNDPFATLYLLDSHGELESKVKWPDYGHITQSQVDWFISTSQALRSAREATKGARKTYHLPLAFFHIPFAEYTDEKLAIRGGKRREPTEGPSFNSHFYDVLADEGVVAVGCGHDHVNDFCALRHSTKESRSVGGQSSPRSSPWLCYNGGTGFGGYCSYDGVRFHRRTRVWEFDANAGSITTWKRKEYSKDRVDEIVLVKNGAVVDPAAHEDVDDWQFISRSEL
ncbi:Metallo-dependent phosphatase [Aaosphaeria arxii CBS 175.79]|uniref:Metallo-dependent phosphatase n=1 Tax=Aaosphaeria arxii CBS 175.79 TaxID=1450172 RepID=A0A6A5XMW1_9PLEO|nr:Metallo-dependent phosphatase [Aaosphaeria arxii CBS 175.79]KAF2014141.1 Metallo-dependent phosphatase [Aaosphaeria arxii CBS 175.79]